MEYYSAIRRNKTGPFTEIWMNLEFIIQSEINQKEKNRYQILMHICGIEKNGTDVMYFQGRNRNADGLLTFKVRHYEPTSEFE